MSTVRRSVARLVPVLVAGLISVPSLLCATTSRASEDVGRINFTLGSKRLTADWELSTPAITGLADTLPPAPASQPALGVEMTWGRKSWPVALAFDVLHSYDDGVQRYPLVNLGVDTVLASSVRRRASTLEIGVGVRRSFPVKDWEPYIGAGGSWVHANVIHEVVDPALGAYGTQVDRESGHDSAFGYWVGGGLLMHFGPRFHLGLSARYSSAKVDLPTSRVVGETPYYHFAQGTSRVDAGGRTVGLAIGWSFPGR
jgi:opacity protein-like surface antigen